VTSPGSPSVVRWSNHAVVAQPDVDRRKITGRRRKPREQPAHLTLLSAKLDKRVECQPRKLRKRHGLYYLACWHRCGGRSCPFRHPRRGSDAGLRRAVAVDLRHPAPAGKRSEATITSSQRSDTAAAGQSVFRPSFPAEIRQAASGTPSILSFPSAAQAGHGGGSRTVSLSNKNSPIWPVSQPLNDVARELDIGLSRATR